MKESITTKSAQLPVSKKFYAEIMERICEACTAFDAGAEMREAITMAIREFITHGASPDGDVDQCVKLAFALLRPEIEKAIERSAAARRRALIRRKTASKQTTKNKPVVGTLRATSECKQPIDRLSPADVARNVPTNTPHNDDTDEEEEYEGARTPNRRERRRLEQQLRRKARQMARHAASRRS